MGEVYCAEDQNLDRQVAIKVLPDVFARDPERLARFEREAKLLASLNHPNIAAIFGLEEAEGKRFLVLELVEGETLAERLKKGSLPLGEALEVCQEITLGLEAAHEKGIIHRDLKPSNIKITPEGKVKILDFGLAKAFLGQASTADLAHSPTITAEMTQPGVVLGTAAYMSPEQAKGKTVDKRADIWAFGCVLFECLAGKNAFSGESVTEIIARIIEAEPEWDLLPKNIHPFLRALLRRCLQKDRNRRLHDIADVRIQIEEGQTAPAEVAAIAASKTRQWPIALIIVGIFAIVAIAAVWMFKKKPEQRSGPVGRFKINLLASQWLYTLGGGLALSPDGSLLAYAADSQLYLRKMNDFKTSPINGTDVFRAGKPAAPVFSPDGNWLAFFADYKLWKISVGGGSALLLGDWGGTPYGASWTDESSIIYGRGEMGIWIVPAAGGEAKPLIAPAQDKKEVYHGPQILKKRGWVLFTLSQMDASWDDAEIVAQSLKTGERKVLIRGGKDGRYVPTGHLVYARGQKLMAARFDLNHLEVLGNPVEVGEELMQTLYPFSHTSISSNGTYVFFRGGPYLIKNKLMWADRKGKITQAASDQQPFGHIGLSPDGHKAAVSIAKEGGGYDIWIYDLSGSAAPLRLTYGGCNWDPVWAPDGQAIVYSAAPTCRSSDDLYLIPADGSSRLPRLLLDRANRQYPYSFDPAGNLLFCDFQSQKGWDIYVLDMKDKKEARPLLDSESTELHPEVSPNGRWIAYVSSESGSEEVYVASYPDIRAKKRISFEGGREPRWSPDGSELFYRNGQQIMAVAVQTAQEFNHLPPARLFAGNFWGIDSWPTYHVAPDGRFLLIQTEAMDGETGYQIDVVVNWFEELRQKAGSSTK